MLSADHYPCIMETPFPSAKDMGWEPSADNFKDCVSLPQVGTFLCDIVKELAPIVKEGLQLWLQVNVHLPDHLRAPQSTVQRVQDALQAASRGSKDAVWMQRYLPDAAAAVMDHMQSQSKAMVKLTKVLKASVSCQQRPFASSWLRAVTSRSTALLQKACEAVLHLLGTAAALANVWSFHRRLTAGQQTGAALLVEHAVRQSNFKQAWKQTLTPLLEAWLDLLPRRCDTALPADDGVHDLCKNVFTLQFVASTVWWKAAVRAPPNSAHDGTVMIGAADWDDMASLLSEYQSQVHADFRQALLHVLVRPDLWDGFNSLRASYNAWDMDILGYAGIAPEDLTTAGMPRPAVEFLTELAKARRREQHECYEACYNSLISACSVAGHEGQGRLDGACSAMGEHVDHTESTQNGGSAPGPENVPAGIRDMFDMQALPQLMYGESGFPGGTQEGSD